MDACKSLSEQIAYQELLVEALGAANSKRDPHEHAQQILDYSTAKERLYILQQKLEQEVRKKVEAEATP